VKSNVKGYYFNLILWKIKALVMGLIIVELVLDLIVKINKIAIKIR
jgi:hypothetical protein